MRELRSWKMNLRPNFFDAHTSHTESKATILLFETFTIICHYSTGYKGGMWGREREREHTNKSQRNVFFSLFSIVFSI